MLKRLVNQNNSYAIIFIVIPILLSITNFAKAQNIKLSPQQQISDIENYYQVLQKRHIGLYRYTSKKEFDTYIDKLIENISDSCHQNEFYKTICELNTQICCGHTKTIFPDSTLMSKVSFIPFSLFCSDSNYFVNTNKTKPYLPIDKKQVISINNIAIDSIVKEIQKYYSADGNIESRKNIFTMNIFPIYYAWFIDDQPLHQIVFCDSLGLLDTLTVNSLNYEILTKRPDDEKEQIEDVLVEHYKDTVNDFTYLGIKSFYPKPESFIPYVDSVFQEISKSPSDNLIIDLRLNNGGKIENEYHLLSYLINKKLNAPYKRYFLDSKFKERSFVKEYIEPQSYQYTGKIYFLMDGYTFSAASEFLSIAQYLKLGIFIGEETGGAADGCNYGNYKYELFNSKIVCQIPEQKSVFTKHLYEKGRGVMPDYPITYTRKDYINGTDKCMVKVVERINSN